MVVRGKQPYLECSTKGFRRLSPFNARPSCLDGASIEDAYHAMKVFDDGLTGLTWRKAKAHKKAGHKVINQDECNIMYSYLWDRYIEENPDLLAIILTETGLSDIFGQEPGPCQVIELWRIRNEHEK